ncbi:MAG: hypothetical protein IAE80_28395 [Anaerolinea sp.]|nr:hypothetical protein [Anaerolinea sp.]
MTQRQLTLIRLVLLVSVITAIIVSQAQAAPVAAANPNASAAAREVLAYMQGLTNRSDNRVVSGQFGSYGDGTTYNTALQQVQAVYNLTGQYPALTGMDCATPAGMNEVVRYMTDMWNAGSLVTLSCHFRNPWTGRSANDWQNTDTPDQWDRRNVRDLTIPGSPGYDAWIAILDNLAAHLQVLEDRGVVVMWRPLHELNGSWFWWGAQAPADFTAFWRHMFDYFTNVKGLNNLLWVYSPNTSISNPPVLANYPGNDVVDMVGLDEYSSLTENPLQINGAGEYDALVSTGKPIGLFEFGPIPASGAGWDTTNYDWGNLIRDIKNRYPRIVLVQAWEYVWQMGYSRYRGQSTFMNDSWVITRSELPRWSSGTSSTSVPPTVTSVGVQPTSVPPTVAPTNVAPTSVAPTTVPPTAVPSTPPTLPPAGTRVTNGLQVLYSFDEGSGSVVNDRSGSTTPINLSITNPTNTRWVTGGGLFVTGSTNITSGRAPTRLLNAIMQSDEVTVEAWVRPANTAQTNGARIITLSNDLSRRNVMLAQWGTQYEARLRHSNGTDGNGTAFMSPANTATTGLQHLVLTRDAAGTTHLYINGVLQSTQSFTGTLDNWNTSLWLNIANELTGDRQWLGEVHLVAVYSRALSPMEVTQNVAAGVHGMTVGTPPVQPTTVPPTAVPPTLPPAQPPTLAPTLVPTIQPTSVPGLGQVVESDNPSVIRSVGWNVVPSAGASAGSYLINTRVQDTLDFTFTGVGVEIIHIGGAFGTFVIEVDGSNMGTVNSITADGEAAYNLHTRIDGLSNGTHVVRIRPQNSIVAIDAFVPIVLDGGAALAEALPVVPVQPEMLPIEPLATLPPAPEVMPTLLPTDIPTDVPTEAPTLEPALPPTEVPPSNNLEVPATTSP